MRACNLTRFRVNLRDNHRDTTAFERTMIIIMVMIIIIRVVFVWNSRQTEHYYYIYLI